MRLLLSLLLMSSLTWADDQVSRTTANNGQLVLEDIPPIREDLVEELRRFQSARSAVFRGFANTGDGLLVSTRFGDVDQIHRVDAPLGMRRQVTFFDEPIGQLAVQPDGSKVAFTMDIGGSEDAQIFIQDLVTGERSMLSDGKSRNGALQWSRDGAKLSYSSTRRNGASNDIWTANFDAADSAKLVFESPDGFWWAGVDWTPNADALLVQRYVGSTQSSISLLDLDSGESLSLSGSNGKSRNLAVGFGEKNRGVYYLTDKSGDFLQLAYRETSKDAVELLITRDIPWDVSSVAMSKDRKRMAFVVNREGFSDLYLMDPESRRYRQVDTFPEGIIGSMDFDAKGERLGLTLTTPTAPADAYVLPLRSTLKAGKLQRWTHSEIGGLAADKFVSPTLVRFPTHGDLDSVPAFVYKPKSDGPHPVIISIHGGPEGQYRPAFSSTIQMWVDKLGAAVIAPNVRGSAGYGKRYVAMDNGRLREDSVRDIGALLDWIATQPDLDESRVAVYGGSYGGYMVLASAVHYSDRLSAAVDIVGISNFVTFLTNTRSYRRDLRRFEYGDEQDPEMRKFLESISPSNQVEKIRVPLMVVQGQNDPRVPVTEAEQIVARVREQGSTVWYMNALNEGHGYRKKENRDIFQQAVVQFFERNLVSQ